MTKFSLVGKLISLVSWFRVIFWIVTQRGKDTHGSEEVKKALIFYHFARKKEIMEVVKSD
jgi:hypothetical protein